MKVYMVGGCVRDEILGLRSKDIDFTVVLEPGDMTMGEHLDAWEPFEVMVARLKSMGFRIFLETPEYLTVRAQFPRATENSLPFVVPSNLTADFVLARKEAGYADGRRPDEVIPGTLEDDLRRRDFTMNAIAKASCEKTMMTVNRFADTTIQEKVCNKCDGKGFIYIDPHNGRADIDAGLIRAVGDPHDRLREDALRAIRALRFSLTKNMRIEGELDKVLHFDMNVLDSVANNISPERISEELNKMFMFNTMKTLRIFTKYPALTEAMFSGRLHLLATLKQKGFK